MKLKELNTFGFDVRALYYSSPVSTEEAKASVAEARSKNLPILALGGGSNILFTRDYPGLVIHPRIGGIDIINEDHSSVLISVGAGIVWDRLVAYTVGRGWGGLENLTLIPGNTGASPVQNIGAYGVEAKDSIESVEGFYFDNLSDFKLDAESCRFNYRDSIFKRELQGKTLITRVEFRLSKNPKFELSYGKLDEEVAKYGQPTLTRIRQSVADIRRSKLPDPAILGNAGSFFKNPTVDKVLADALQETHPQIPQYPATDGRVKLAAGSMIELCGFKGTRHGNVGVHHRQALVLVNHGNGTPTEILELSDMIRRAVLEKFGVEIETEVNII